MIRSSSIGSSPYGSRAFRAVVFVAVVLTACNRKQTTARNDQRAGAGAARAVRTAVVAEQRMERTVSVNGALAARDETTLSVKVPGRLQTIAVDLGSVVRQGQLIAQVEPRDYELQLKQAEALLGQARARLGLSLQGDDDKIELDQTSLVKEAKARLDEARKNRDRIESLAAQGILSQSERETADASYEVAANRYRDALEEANNRRAQLVQRRVEVDIARKQLADTAIQAPFDGAVQERRASQGEYLTAGSPVATVVRMDPLRMRVEVPEVAAAAVRIGQNVRLALDGDPSPHKGTINRVSPGITRDSHMLVVEADVPNDGSLRPGSFARAEIITKEDDRGLCVPASAITTFAGIEKVFVVEKGKVVEKPVTTGRRGGDWVEIVIGLKTGEVVVLDPGNLQTGQAVTTAGS
jgi:membrane fusion protein, multidrug efflux system